MNTGSGVKPLHADVARPFAREACDDAQALGTPSLDARLARVDFHHEKERTR